MKPTSTFVLILIASVFGALLSGASAPAKADGAREVILADLLSEAQTAEPSFSGFSAQRGEAFYLAKHTGGKPDTRSCASCHSDSASGSGQTRAGKVIEPMAVSINPSRYTDVAKVAKWFSRNCNSVLGRECSAIEKGDFLTFMINQ